ncbi:hypothetical protein BGZ83_010663 [Gryganskiella cystojenkinii]|nr:hypothetical protein BGZ83_010663 [Gryganskiella cystojenkinii]
MDRKSILNCSLVSSHWHGPARMELERIIQDMPFNGQGLVHAIRTRFAADSFPFLSMALFDKLVCNLSELYYHSNPETKQVFAPANAPDMLYHLFWTFLFIDQEFRNTRSRPKVTCNYFVHLLQNEGGGYPRQYFDKKVLKSIYNDIKARPLLPAPHLIRVFQDADGSAPNNINTNNHVSTTGVVGNPPEIQARSQTTSHDTQRPSNLTRQNSLMDLASSIRYESFGRLRRWWRHVREDLDQNQVGWVSHLELPSSLSSTHIHPTTTPSNHPQQQGVEDTTVAMRSSLSSSISPASNTEALNPTNPTNSDATLPSRSSSTSSSSTSHRRQIQPIQPVLQHSVSSTFPQGNVASTASFGSVRSRSGTQSDMSLSPTKVLSTSQTMLHNSRSNSNRSSVLNQGFTSVSFGWHPQGDGLDEVVRFPKSKRASALELEYQVLQCSTLMLEMDMDS